MCPVPGLPEGHSCSTDLRSSWAVRSVAGCAALPWKSVMDRFLGFVKQIRRSRRRKGKKYRPEEDYQEGYEDVYYYASEHFRRYKLLVQNTEDPGQ
ncbi:hypothetical protein STEG23_015817 [Scotinomys teguina]